MQIDWSPVRAELALWRREGLPLDIWWRDDDAIAHTSALDQLATMAADLSVPVHLAVIPKAAQSSLVDACLQDPALIPLVHGWAHQNNAPVGAKKAEFGHSRPDLEDDCSKGLARMHRLFGDDVVDCFVPPWNRIAPDLIATLPGLGFTFLSTFAPRQARSPAPDLIQINTHLDPIDWRGGGGVLDPEVLVTTLRNVLQDRREGRADPSEPLGLLTHHLVHDPPIWAFSKSCLGTLLEGGARPTNPFDLKDNVP